MSGDEIARLERDVEEARARLAADVARLRSPGTFAKFKADVSHDLTEAKDQALAKVKDAARERTDDLLTAVGDRVVAHPMAVLAIGAGLAWRIAHRPPIATALVGLGLYGLLRNGGPPGRHRLRRYPSQEGNGRDGAVDWRGTGAEFVSAAREQISEATEGARATIGEYAATTAERVGEWASDASQATRRTVASAASAAHEKVSELTGAAVEQAGELTSEAAHKTQRTLANAGGMARSWTDDGRQRIARLAEEAPSQDKVLLGVAALGIAAAIGIAAQRRLSAAE